MVPINETDYSTDELTEICEDAFINIKEACMRLQEKTNCQNKVIIEMLTSVADYYRSKSDQYTKH